MSVSSALYYTVLVTCQVSLSLLVAVYVCDQLITNGNGPELRLSLCVVLVLCNYVFSDM